MPAKKSIGCNGRMIRHYRIRKSWTQKDLAEKSGYSSRLISKAESGGVIAIDTIKDIAQALSDSDVQLNYEDLVSDPIELAKEFVQSLYYHRGENSLSRVAHLIDKDAVFHINGDTKTVPFAGIHQGIEDIQTVFQSIFELLEVPEEQDQRAQYRCYGSANEVIVWGNCWIHPTGRPMNKPVEVTLKLVFESGKLVEYHERFDPLLSAHLVKAIQDSTQ